MGNHENRRAGFTLVELMIVVAIIGILAAVAIPAFVKYVRRSKTVEVTMNIRKLFDSTVSYYLSEQADASGNVLNKVFPADSGVSGGWRPAYGSCCGQTGQKCAPNPSQWQGQPWVTLNFSVDDPGYYFYYGWRMSGDGSQPGHQYALRGDGDLDCDNIYANYWRTATVAADRSIAGGSGVFMNNPIE